MPKKTVTEVYAEIDTLLADNTTGAITPTKMRTVLKSLGDALKPSFAVMLAASKVINGVAATPVVITGFTSKVETDTTDATADITTGVLGRFGGSGVFEVSGSIASSQNRLITLVVRRGTTVLRSLQIQAGPSPVPFTFLVSEYFPTAESYTAAISTTTSTNVTLTNLSFKVTSSPTL